MVVYCSAEAYAKAILHAWRYPQNAVNGAFLGYVHETTKDVHIEDAVPLFHNQLSLSPMLEVALSQVSYHLKMRITGGFCGLLAHLGLASLSLM